MPYTRISNAQLNSRGATTLPNQPQISAAALKQEFDAPAKNIVAPAVNNLMDELEASTSANSLGAVAPTGRTGTTVQGVLNSISSDLATLETNAAPAIANAHSHSNKAVIDKLDDTGTGLTYDGNPVGAVTSVNGKTGAVSLTASDVGALPSSTSIPSKTSDLTNDSGFITSSDIPAIPTRTSDLTNDSNFVADASYVHTDNNYDADAVSKKHSHSNKTVIDKFGEDSGGNPTYDGNPIGGGGSADAYKTITSGGQSFVASGADEFKINAGSNVTITPLASPDKGIQISASGGGSSTGDMLMNDYDRSGDVKSASSSGNGIKDYVASAISGKADTSSLATVATSGSYNDLSNKPTIPTVTDTYSGTSSNGMSGKAVKSAIDALDVTVSGAGAGKTLATLTETDGKIAATFQNISITKSQISDFPTIPTVNNATLTIQKNGTNVQTFTANQSTNATANIITDDWVKTASVSSGSVTFSGIDDSGNYGYEVFFNITSSSTNKNPSAQLSTISGEGTANMSLTYTTDADNGTNNAKLRRIR